MKKKPSKRRVAKFGLIAALVCAIFWGVIIIKAQVGYNLKGWIWGGSESISDGDPNNGYSGFETGVGLISLNSSNCDANEDNVSEGASGCPPLGEIVASYGVNIPSTEGASLVGHAYSSNLGYIDFGGARRIADTVQGWARFTEIAAANAAGNSGGWSGWISMSSLNCDADGDGFSDSAAAVSAGNCPNAGTTIANYGVKIEDDGKLSGHAWSDELGYIALGSSAGSPVVYGGNLPTPPTVTLTADPGAINIEEKPEYATTGVSIMLKWSGITNATSCKKDWDDLDLASMADGQEDETQTSVPNKIYTITCYGPGGETAASATVAAFCNETACSGTCKETPVWNATDPATQCIKQCSGDSECGDREVTKWLEVSP